MGGNVSYNNKEKNKDHSKHKQSKKFHKLDGNNTEGAGISIVGDSALPSVEEDEGEGLISSNRWFFLSFCIKIVDNFTSFLYIMQYVDDLKEQSNMIA